MQQILTGPTAGGDTAARMLGMHKTLRIKVGGVKKSLIYLLNNVTKPEYQHPKKSYKVGGSGFQRLLSQDRFTRFRGIE